MYLVSLNSLRLFVCLPVCLKALAQRVRDFVLQFMIRGDDVQSTCSAIKLIQITERERDTVILIDLLLIWLRSITYPTHLSIQRITVYSAQQRSTIIIIVTYCGGF